MESLSVLQQVEYDDALIFLFENKISNLQPLLPLLDAVIKTGKPLIIIAEDVDGEALAALVLNKLRGGLKVAVVKAPGFGDNRKASMQDIAVSTGGQLVSEEVGLKLEEVSINMLGRAKKISITKDDTIILGGAGTNFELDERCQLIREAIATTTSDYEKEKLQERLARLSGGVAVIKVGGASEVEVGEKKDRIDDALNATRAAVQEGIVPGGGVALLYASQGILPSINTCAHDKPINTHVNDDQVVAPVVHYVTISQLF
jgi:chaperonin GroEL